MTEPLIYSCSVCGQSHSDLMDLACEYPLPYQELPAETRSQVAQLTSDTCILRGQDRFIRAILEIPVHGREDTFAYGVWVSLGQGAFDSYLAAFDDPQRPIQAPAFGWLSNRLPGYPDTFLLRAHVHFRPHPERPQVELEPTDHPLALEQRQGITEGRLRAILEATLHGRSTT